MLAHFVEVELGGETWKLVLDLNAVGEMERELGKGLGEIMGEKTAGINMIISMYYYGLKQFPKQAKVLTLKKTGSLLQHELLEGKELKDLMEPIKDALKRSRLLKETPEEVNEDEENEFEDIEPEKN